MWTGLIPKEKSELTQCAERPRWFFTWAGLSVPKLVNP